MPSAAEQACPLYVLPANPTLADLEIGYATRGTQIILCDGKRQLAVATHAAEHRLEAEQLKARERRLRPWWRVW